MRLPVAASSRPLAVWLAALTLACSGADTPATDRPNNASADAGSRADRGAGVASDSAEQARVDSVLAAIAACPRDGRWHPCSLEHRLQLAGLRPVRLDSASGDDARIPGIDAPTVVWRTGARTLRAAFFADSAAARAAFATLDSVGAAPRGGAIPAWPAPPTLFRGANAVLVYLGGTSRQIERVTDAVLAGPPQPK
ncbi:MAG TPA: hypothetical protein PKE51_04180 [Gemmatimonadaceae bacterium]|nr:hypothetical protein [Gemmatimonadaceae bacterium]